MHKKFNKTIVVGFILLLYAAPLTADDHVSFTGKVSSGGIEKVSFLAFQVNAADGSIVLAGSDETELTFQAEESLALAPQWLRGDLRDSLSRISAEDQDTIGAILLGIDDARIIDEVAFTFAQMGPEMIEYSRDYLGVAVENAEWIYLIDPDLDYVEIVDVGDPLTDEDFYTTARYTVIDDGIETDYMLPQDVYYWYVVHPILDCNHWLRKIYPPSGFSTETGEWWRKFYYEDNSGGHYRRPQVMCEPNDITDSELASFDFGVAAAYSLFTGPDRSYSAVVRQTGSRAPVFISFIHGNGRCCSTQEPNPDGHVFATTIPVEAAAMNGDDALLENMLRAGQGNRELRTNILLSDNLGDTAPRKILILRNGAPFDALEDPNETILASLGRDYDVLDSDALYALELTTAEAPFVPSEYIKIVVPSDQPPALYQAISDNAEKIQEFVDFGGVFEFHAAARPEYDWTGLAMPFGIEALPMDGSNATDDIEVAGFPLLKEVIENTTYLWDRQKTVLPGERAYDPGEGAIAKIGWWVANNLPWRALEMAYWRRNPALQRGADPVRTLYNHYGNCGELQDVYGPAMRTLLIPSSAAGTFADDHVWNEFYENDRWHPLQATWSCSTTRIEDWGVAYDADTDSSTNDIAGMTVTRPDCYLYNVLGRYEPEIDGDGIIQSGDYSYYVTLRATVLDRNARPVDGARIMIAAPSYRDPMSLLVATWAFTDSNGVAEFTVGENEAYYYRIESVIGTLPDEEHVDLWVNETETLEPGTVIERTFQFSGLDSHGMPFPYVPWIDVSEISYTPPDPVQDAWALSVDIAVHRELAYGQSPLLEGLTWREPAGQGLLDVYLMDEPNYLGLVEGRSADAIAAAQDVSEYALDVDLSVDSGMWYLVVAGPDRVVNAREVSVDLETHFRAGMEEEWMPEEDDTADESAEPVPDAQGDGPEENDGAGGCGCSLAR